MSTWSRIRYREFIKGVASRRTRKQLLARSLTPGFFAYNVNTTGYHEATTNAPTISNIKTALSSFQESVTTKQLESEIIRVFHSNVRQSFQSPHIKLDMQYSYVRNQLSPAMRSILNSRLPTFDKTFRVERAPILARRHQHLRLSKRSYSHMPHLPHRPTKAEVLAQARGFFERLRVRIRFILMRSMRPWTLNDIGAVFSWVFLGQTVWLLVGTTSFVSLILWTANSLQFQEWIAYRIGQYLTSATGATVIFDSAIVPNWKEGKITFKNVRISRMPQSERAKFERKTGLQDEDGYNLHTSAGSPISSGALESITLLTGSSGPDSDDNPLAGVYFDDDEKNNEVLKKWMWFDLRIESIQVTLNLVRWLDGKGLVQDADVHGVRGVVDRRHVRWDPNVPWDPVAARQKYTPGDFELEKLIIDDLLVTVYQPYGFRPYPVSIFSAELNRFRKQWLFYDILCAKKIVGSFDKCLFSVHTPQLEKSVLEQSSHIDMQSKFRSHDIYHYYPKPNPDGVVVGDENSRFGIINEMAMEERGYKRMSRLRIDGVNTDHIFRRIAGPPGWISSGQVDVSADIYIPKEATTADSTELLRKLVYEIADKIELPQPVVLGTGNGEDEIVIGAHKYENELKPKPTTEPQFVMDIDFRFKNTKANIPLQAPELTYLSNAMVRPIVAYINRNKTIVPIKCRVVLPLSNFDGSWTAYDSMLIDSISEQLGKGFVDLTVDQQERNRRLKRIGFWSLQEITRNLVALHELMKGTSRGFWSFLGTTSHAT
ncbi:mitochondrial distribution and morphology proteins-domain-containing protein [Umbelopsis sp. PMI_123]|nr:mitochondrial distribution and morphology proteins-domain-containing protein [Umbelopsis sp. PMI_123]